jgi:hypothetical protein
VTLTAEEAAAIDAELAPYYDRLSRKAASAELGGG